LEIFDFIIVKLHLNPSTLRCFFPSGQRVSGFAELIQMCLKEV
jgi:hypothetical protein